MRGEDIRMTRRRTCVFGSPPHARGRHFQKVGQFPRRRITPACAGKTKGVRVSDIARKDHPRMRGEDDADGHAGHVGRGSPPHARGRRLSVLKSIEKSRITPACAGKTPFSSLFNSCSSDHPRMRGEDFAAVQSALR